MSTLSATITDDFTTGGVIQIGQVVSAEDIFYIDDFPPFGMSPVATYGVVLAQGITIGSSNARQYRGGGLVVDTPRLASALAVKGKYLVSQAETLRLRETLRLAFQMLLAEGLTLTDVAELTMAVQLIEQLRIHPALTATGHFTASLVQALRFHDVARFFLGGLLTDDVLSFSDSLARTYKTFAPLTENLALAEALGGSLLFRVELDDTIELTPSQLIQAIYQGDVLEDTINLFVAYVDPGGSFTTWAINTRTAAVTEYENFVFNSIVRRGNRFYGTASDGLYELDGADDDGVSIATQIKTGLMQMAGSKFTSFKAIYLGLKIKDDGTDVFIKLHAGDGREYTYAVKPNDTATTRVNTGKGLRARYFSFELSTVAADYDLDSVEFLPLSSKRRI